MTISKDFTLVVVKYFSSLLPIIAAFLVSSTTYFREHFNFNYFNLTPPKPHPFVNLSKQGVTGGELADVLSSLQNLLPQLQLFIDQFNHLIIHNTVNIVQQADGSMFIDVPKNMPESEWQDLTKRFGILDNVIATRSDEIKDHIREGLKIEEAIWKRDPNYKSQILEKAQEFQRIKDSFKG